MNELQYLKHQRELHGNRALGPNDASLPIEALDYQPETIESYQNKNGKPYLVDRLMIDIGYKIDPSVEVKIAAVNELFERTIELESLRKGIASYNNVLERFISKAFPEFEREVRRGNGIKILEQLFNEAAIRNRMSSESYLKHYSDKLREQKISYLLGELKRQLITIK